MSCPSKPYSAAAAYVAAYGAEIARAWQSIDLTAFDRAAELLETAIRDGRMIYACGNGGSAAISNHLVCDVLKGVQTDTALRPKIVSLARLEVLTAIANDIGYEEGVVYQLRTQGAPGDVLFTLRAPGKLGNNC